MLFHVYYLNLCVQSPSVEALNTCLDMALGNQLQVALLKQGMDQMIPRGPFQPQPSYDSVIYVKPLQNSFPQLVYFTLVKAVGAPPKLLPQLSRGTIAGQWCLTTLSPFLGRPHLQDMPGPSGLTTIHTQNTLWSHLHMLCTVTEGKTKPQRAFLSYS